MNYVSGQSPERRDVIQYADQSSVNRRVNPEARELWIVTSVSADMVKAKCLGKPAWKQAFYTNQMSLVIDPSTGKKMEP